VCLEGETGHSKGSLARRRKYSSSCRPWRRLGVFLRLIQLETCSSVTPIAWAGEEGKRKLLAYTLSLADVIRGVLAAQDPERARQNPDAIKRRAAEIADNVTGLWEMTGKSRPMKEAVSSSVAFQ
jgi:hypothetical protein